jgi:hypothetical protein
MFAYLADPPVVLVLVVDHEGEDVSAYGSLLRGRADVASVDGGHLGVDACCDRCPEGGKLIQARQFSRPGSGVAESISASKAGFGLASAAVRLRSMK